MEIPSKLQEEIKYYCKINNIEDVNKFLVKIITKGFTLEKYGSTPSNIIIKPKEEKKPEIEPISLELPEPIQKIIDETLANQLKVLDSLNISNELEINKKRDLYDEE